MANKPNLYLVSSPDWRGSDANVFTTKEAAMEFAETYLEDSARYGDTAAQIYLYEAKFISKAVLKTEPTIVWKN